MCDAPPQWLRLCHPSLPPSPSSLVDPLTLLGSQVRMGVGAQVVGGNAMIAGSANYEATDRKREDEEAGLPSFTAEDAKE